MNNWKRTKEVLGVRDVTLILVSERQGKEEELKREVWIEEEIPDIGSDIRREAGSQIFKVVERRVNAGHRELAIKAKMVV